MTKPFLKWAGGKRWLTNSRQLPDFGLFDRYIEPFLGSASIFFYLEPKSALLSDANAELINCYNAIKHDPRLVRRYLGVHSGNHSDSYYYAVRSSSPRSEAARAAKFLYLNRSCWNGLYRVNKQGIFNVPRGTKDQIIFDDDDFGKISEKLQSAQIKCVDFEEAILEAGKGDLVFADPPYTVRHNVNGFVKYNENILVGMTNSASAVHSLLHLREVPKFI
jgi:DNA adenine methylase